MLERVNDVVIWKKRSKIKFLFVLAFILFNYTVSFAKEDSKAELTFTLTKGKEAIITGGEVGEQLLIPKSIEGYPVVGIGDNAFENQTEIRRVMIEGGVRYIGTRAFEGCTAIQAITLPEEIQYIGERAFGKCESLTKIEGLTETYTYVDDDAFAESGWEERQATDKFIIRGSKGITAKDDQGEVMEVPYGIIRLEKYFAGVISASPEIWDLGCKEVILPDTVTMMEAGVFRGLTIERINLPDNIEEIPYLAFADSKVQEIFITEYSKIKKIGGSAFSRTEIDVNCIVSCLKKLEIIESRAFESCMNLSSLTLPSSVQRVGDDVFAYCTNLSLVNFEEGLLEISGSAFYECPIKRLQFPESLREIKGEYLKLKGLEKVYISEKVELSEALFHDFRNTSLIVYGQSGSDAEKAATAAGLPFIEVEEGKDMP